jgi:O-antigen ligase
LTLLYPIPIVSLAIAALALWIVGRRTGGLKALLAAGYCGVMITSFTGGASGGVWLVEVFLVLVGLFVLWRRPLAAGRSRSITFWTHALLVVFLVGIFVGLFRYDPTLQGLKAGSFASVAGVPLNWLMAGYRLAVLACIYLAFTIPLRYRIDHAALTQCLRLTWVFAVLLAVAGILDYVGVADLAFTLSREIGYERESLFGFHRGALGMLSVIGIFLSFAMTQATQSSLLKAAAYVSAPVLVVAMLLTWSRSAVVAMAVGAISLVLTQGGPRALRGLVVTAFGGGIAFILLAQVPEVRERFMLGLSQSAAEGSAGRIPAWTELVAWLLHRPDVLVTGCGFQNFNYYVTVLSGANPLRGAHNSYLHVLTEFGLLGTAVYLAWLTALVRWLWSWRRSCPTAQQRALIGTFLSLVMALMVGGITLESLVPSRTFVPVFLYTLLILGVLVSYCRTTAPTTDLWPRPARRWRVPSPAEHRPPAGASVPPARA